MSQFLDPFPDVARPIMRCTGVRGTRQGLITVARRAGIPSIYDCDDSFPPALAAGWLAAPAGEPDLDTQGDGDCANCGGLLYAGPEPSSEARIDADLGPVGSPSWWRRGGMVQIVAGIRLR